MQLIFRNKKLDLSLSPAVMGILNVTPDSFFDGGKFTDERALLLHAEKMMGEGADIIDIGACSTRPNAEEVSQEEELKRLIPAIKLVRKKFADVIISADTFRSKVAEEAVNAGADMINDVSGGNGFPVFGLQSTVKQPITKNQQETVNSEQKTNMFETIVKLKAPYVLTHIQGTPQTMQKNPQYKDVVKEVKDYFTEKILQLKNLGATNIILDVGFGFGKNLEHNYTLLKNLADFKSFGLPILAGISRKSMINKLLGTNPETALNPVGYSSNGVNGTTAANTIALMNGANILRVHDVKEAKEAVKIFNFVNNK